MKFTAALLLLVLLLSAGPAVSAEDTQPTSTGLTAVDSSSYPNLLWGSSGDAVVDLQRRLHDLGYYNYKITGSYGQLTATAVEQFQKCNKITATGNVGPLTNAVLYTNNAVRMPMSAIDENSNRLGQTPTPSPKPQPKYGQLLDWFKTVQYTFSRGTTAKVIDFYSGVSFTVKRTGGSKHADCETINAAETAKFKTACGKYYGTWQRRPVIVVINGQYIAASMNCLPHTESNSNYGGYDSISGNNMDGEFCIHFLNSRTHVANSVDAQHQACVRIAAGK